MQIKMTQSDDGKQKDANRQQGGDNQSSSGDPPASPKFDIGVVGPGITAEIEENNAMASYTTVPLEDGASANLKKANMPMHLKFQDLTVSVDTADGKRQILQNVTGEVKPGEVIAIMGPSGAGKTTLLNILAGRLKRTGGEIEKGEVTINGKKITKRLRRHIGYVLQEDVFFSHLTLKRTLQFAAELRLPGSMTRQEKLDKVSELIDTLGVRKCENTIMGGGFFARGLSGGERKRASIGVELLTNPSLLLMDEPTSGLDSSTAYSLINLLKKLAAVENKTIACTIHQPSSQIFHMFDKLLLLCNGRIAYYGKTSGVMDFFNEIDMPCYPNWNPADYIMEKMKAGKDVEDKICDEFQSRYGTNLSLSALDCQSKSCDTRTPEKKMKAIEWFSSRKEKSPDVKLNGVRSTGDIAEIELGVENEVQIKGKLSVKESSPADQDEDEFSINRWQASYLTQVKVLTARSFIQTKANIWDKLNFIQAFALAIICGLLWFQTPYTEETIRDRTAVFFFATVYWGFTPLFQALVSFPEERNVIAKERASGMYRLSAYYIAKCLSELPLVIFQPFLFWTVVYWMAGLNTSAWFLVSILGLMVSSIAAQSIGLAISAAVMHFKKSLIIASVVMLSFMLLGGFYNQNIPSWLSWVKYVSFITYSYTLLLVTEFKDSDPFRCKSVASEYLVCTGNTTQITGQEILDHLGVDFEIWHCFLILIAYTFLFRSMCYAALRYLNKPK